jgi:hypothetical protein
LLLHKIEFMNLCLFTPLTKKIYFEVRFNLLWTVGCQQLTGYVNHKNIFSFLDFP